MVTAILKGATILCMLAFLFLVFMVIGWIPSKRVCKFFREHKVVLGVYGVLVGIGFIAACIV